MPKIHATAVVDTDAQLADDVVIGPGCVVVGPVELGPGVVLHANVFVQGPARIGARTRVWPGASIGADAQDYKVKPGFPTGGVVVGEDCLIREGATVHAATKADAPTRIGNRVFMMVNSHAGHDAQVGNDVIMVNGSMLGGHAVVQDRATLSGNVCVHQFCRVGRFAFLSGGSIISTEVPPFCATQGRNALAGMNLVGMRRNGFSSVDITLARQAYREAFRSNLQRHEMVQRLERVAVSGPGGAASPCAAVVEMMEFVKAAKRAICPYRPQGRVESADAPM